MRFISRSAFAALVAVFVMSAVGVASASAALPEFVLGEGEKFPVTIEKKYKNVQGFFENTSGSKFGTCTGVGVKGEITGAKAGSLTIEMENCHQGSLLCHSVGSEQEHEVFSGNVSLDYIKKATKQVGIVLKLNEIPIVCGKTTINIKGGLVIPITPINTKTSTLDLRFNGAAGIQEFTSYENEKGEIKHEAMLTWFGVWRESDLVINEGKQLELPTSKAVTINA
jgi:hypothetical protein